MPYRSVSSSSVSLLYLSYLEDESVTCCTKTQAHTGWDLGCMLVEAVHIPQASRSYTMNFHDGLKEQYRVHTRSQPYRVQARSQPAAWMPLQRYCAVATQRPTFQHRHKRRQISRCCTHGIYLKFKPLVLPMKQHCPSGCHRAHLVCGLLADGPAA